MNIIKKKIEDTKGVIGSRKSKMDNTMTKFGFVT